MVKGMTVDNLPTPKPPEVKELKQAEETLRKMFESVTDGISATDLDGITRCKPKNK